MEDCDHQWLNDEDVAGRWRRDEQDGHEQRVRRLPRPAELKDEQLGERSLFPSPALARIYACVCSRDGASILSGLARGKRCGGLGVGASLCLPVLVPSVPSVCSAGGQSAVPPSRAPPLTKGPPSGTPAHCVLSHPSPSGHTQLGSIALQIIRGLPTIQASFKPSFRPNLTNQRDIPRNQYSLMSDIECGTIFHV